ncbi:metalloregulator ArsR/SmtB family transcription factor [Microbacterium sp. MPKO10]|uniref:helix-turn-helix transcriptional regulator n=1 Tax=Microbacterium sp. MPKO10 TaxID=2989818 RepID=UPI002235A51A|nr:helix-turn-helix domain-containing protein [Microbacterium sp. MPKO10]MCW4458896.1 helix-turn-helix domain-containing protein [Microbacterium sp. MPKO10]
MGRIVPEHYRVLASPSRIELLYLLQTRGAQSVEQLAEASGLHTNTAREHLHLLIEAGFVHSQPIRRSGRGRPRIRYSVADSLSDPATARRVRDAYDRADLVRRIVAPHAATRCPTPADRQLDILEDQLDTCGFEATIDETDSSSDAHASTDSTRSSSGGIPDKDDASDSTRITLHHCPYYDLAGQHPHVCDVHFGLLGTALGLTDGPLEASDLHARDPEKGCWVTLTRRQRTEDIA